MTYTYTFSSKLSMCIFYSFSNLFLLPNILFRICISGVCFNYQMSNVNVFCNFGIHDEICTWVCIVVVVFNLQVNYFITAFYDSTIYLAVSYKTVLDEGGDINDGMYVAQRLWNTTFQGMTSCKRHTAPHINNSVVILSSDLFNVGM